MTYLLDSNTVIARLNGDPRVSKKLKKLALDEVVLCSPVLAELEFGAWLSTQREENLERLHKLAAGMRFETFGFEAALLFGELKASLRRKGITKSDFDLSITAIALDLKAILVSDDHAFFDESISGLKVQNWLQTPKSADEPAATS